MTTKFIGIIPARYASSRFPGKPLAKLGTKPVIQHVYEKCQSCLDDVLVATDDTRIMDAVEAFGGQAIMTSTKHRSGTDRVWEAYQKSGSKADVIINIQGDEPFLQESQLRSLMDCFKDAVIDIATLVKPYEKGTPFALLSDPNTPKVVCQKNGQAIYFSRSVIPYLRDVDKDLWTTQHCYYKHLGVYAYRASVLEKITALDFGVLEQAESLEQLRWLENGYKIAAAVTHFETIGIDTPKDLEQAQLYLKQLKG